MIVDSHIHGDARSSYDFKSMCDFDVGVAVTCSYYPYTLRNQSCLLNLFDRLLEFDVERASLMGVDLKVACGIHPGNILDSNDLIFEELRCLAEDGRIVAIGEIGLELNTLEERDVLEKQVRIADEYNLPVIIHTPSKFKLESCKSIVSILESNIRDELVVIDHVNSEIIDYVIDLPYTLGLSVQPTYMISENEAIGILDSYGFDRFILNSDMSIFPSSCLTVPNLVTRLKEDYKKSLVDSVAYKNAFEFFNIEK